MSDAATRRRERNKLAKANETPEQRTARRRRLRQTEGEKLRRKREKIRYAQRYPEKVRAWYAVKDAKKAGKLKPQACACGALKAQAHHEDYSRRLDVEWV
ncbi:MAG: hypothetical protein E6R03_06155, partial [Hyphomicrobiaceae bacterium]